MKKLRKSKTLNLEKFHMQSSGSRHMKIIIYFLVIFLTTAIISGCGKGRADRAKLKSIPVKVMKVKLESLKKLLEYAGSIKGRDEAIVYPKVSGKIIEKVREDGSPINKGEPILFIDRDEIGLKFEKAPVESPLTGIVGRIYVDIGSSVTYETPVALVADMAEAKINLDIPEKYLPKVSLDQEAEVKVDAYPESKFIGRVTKISPVIDLATRAAPVEITLDNKDGRLQSGMFARVKLVLEEYRNVPIILKEAVIGKEPEAYVYIVEDGLAILRKISLGIREGPYLEVRGGLKEGDYVVIMGQQKLRDGASVEAEE